MLAELAPGVFVGAGFRRTLDMLKREGFDAKGLAVSEIAKLDAGLSCMSLRWRSHG